MRTKWAALVAAGLGLTVLAFAGTAGAASFVGTQTGPSEWTYTLTYDPLDNYAVCPAPDNVATITLSGLAGVVSATAPTSTDFTPAGGLLDTGNLQWTPQVLAGGTVVTWTHVGPGTGNFGTAKHVYGFKVLVGAPATSGHVNVASNGFSVDASFPATCPMQPADDRDFTGITVGPLHRAGTPGGVAPPISPPVVSAALSPVVDGSVKDSNGDGNGDLTYDAVGSVVIGSGHPSLGRGEERGVFEFDLAALRHRCVRFAQLQLNVAGFYGADSDLVYFHPEFTLYAGIGDGVISANDYESGHVIARPVFTDDVAVNVTRVVNTYANHQPFGWHLSTTIRFVLAWDAASTHRTAGVLLGSNELEHLYGTEYRAVKLSVDSTAGDCSLPAVS